MNTRHPENTNCNPRSVFPLRDLAVMASQPPQMSDLDRSCEVIDLALAEHSRLSAIRFDLSFPAGRQITEEDRSNLAISKFIDLLTISIRSHRARFKREQALALGTGVRWIWVREERAPAMGHQHYHFALLLNWDAYRSVDSFNSGRNSLYQLIQSAWARALRMDVCDADELVDVPFYSSYKLTRNSDSKTSEFPAFLKWISYMCKATSTVHGNGYQAFNSSRG